MNVDNLSYPILTYKSVSLDFKKKTNHSSPICPLQETIYNKVAYKERKSCNINRQN